MRLVERFTTSIDSVPPSDYLTLGAALTEEEERSPYSSYYRRGPAPIPAEQAEALAPGRRLEPSRAFPPEEMARHMLVPHVDIRLSGCRVLPDGTAFGAAWCDMSAVTQEMEDFFDAHWNPGGDLFYKIWYPGAHVRHYADAAIESLGREPEILTGMAATGAQIMLFSTGRGAPQGFPSMPVVKICGNPNTYERMQHDMDLNAGRIITGEKTIEEVGEEAFELMLRVLSGQMTKNEALGYYGSMDIFCLGPVI